MNEIVNGRDECMNEYHELSVRNESKAVIMNQQFCKDFQSEMHL